MVVRFIACGRGKRVKRLIPAFGGSIETMWTSSVQVGVRLWVGAPFGVRGDAAGGRLYMGVLQWWVSTPYGVETMWTSSVQLEVR